MRVYRGMIRDGYTPQEVLTILDYLRDHNQPLACEKDSRVMIGVRLTNIPSHLVKKKETG